MTLAQFVPAEAIGPLVHVVTLLTRTLMLGALLFLVCLLRPLGWTLGDAGAAMRRDCARIAAIAALVLLLCTGIGLAPAWSGVLAQADPVAALSAAPAVVLSGLAEAAVALLVLLLLGAGWAPSVLLLVLTVADLAAATLLSAGAALPYQPAALGLEASHQLGVALWLGGIPPFVTVLVRLQDGQGWRAVAARFAGLSGAGLLAAIVSGVWLGMLTTSGEISALYGTRYGVLLCAKVVLSLGLVLSLAGVVMAVARRAGGPRLALLRLKRLAEIQAALGLAVFLTTAALTASPAPMQTAGQDGATWPEVVAQERPVLPNVGSLVAAPQVFTAWFRTVPRQAGLAAAVIALVALLATAGVRSARHWPLLVVALGVAAFVYADPQVWPLASVGPLDGLDDPAVLWHRIEALLLIALGLIEWRARAFGRGRRGAALLLPLLMGVAGLTALLLPAPAGTPAQQALGLIAEAPLAVLAIAAGCARWLEMRLDTYDAGWAGALWSACVLLMGVLLMFYPAA